MSTVTDLVFVVKEKVQFAVAPADLSPVVHSPADRQPALAYLAGLGASSRATMADALSAIAAYLTGGSCDLATLPWHELRRQHVNAVRSWLADSKAVSTGNRYLAALRGTLRECWRLGLMDHETFARAIDVAPIRGSGPDQAAGRALTAGEIAAMLAVCAGDPSPAGPRDAAILGLGVRCGLRRAEIAGLQIGDYDAHAGAVSVLGKGNKRRVVPVAIGVDDALADWLHVRGAEPGPLFLAINKGGRILAGGISDAAVYDALAKRGAQAGVRRFSPHDLRRTYIGDLLDAGADLSTVQKLAGHSQATTTARYDRRDRRAMQAAAHRLHLGWTRRYCDGLL